MQWHPTGFKLWLTQHRYAPDSHHSFPQAPFASPPSIVTLLTIMRGFSAFSWKCPLTTSLSAAQLQLWPVAVASSARRDLWCRVFRMIFYEGVHEGKKRRENPLRLDSEPSLSKKRINYLSLLRNLIQSNAAGKSQAAVTWSILLHPDWIPLTRGSNLTVYMDAE